MTNQVRITSGSLAASWTNAFNAADLNSLGAGYVAVSTIAFDNSAFGDLWASVSLSLTGTTTGTNTPGVSLYVLPLNQDGATYGDGVASGATVPSASLFERSLLLPLNKTSSALTGTMRRVGLPEGGFVLALVNNTGNALASSGNVVKIRTFVENLNG